MDYIRLNRIIRLVMSCIVLVVSLLFITNVIAPTVAMSISLPLLGIVNILYGVDYYKGGRKKHSYAYFGLGTIIILVFVFDMLF